MLLEVLSSADGLDSRDRPLAALREERAGVFLASVNCFVAYVSPLGGWRPSFGDTPILDITHWVPLPELPRESAVV